MVFWEKFLSWIKLEKIDRIRSEDNRTLSKYVGFLLYRVPSESSFMSSMRGPLRSQGETLPPTWIGEARLREGRPVSGHTAGDMVLSWGRSRIPL